MYAREVCKVNIVTNTATNLFVDLSPVESHDGITNFKVQIDASRLLRLIDDAKSAHRIYEFMLLDHPGDVWDYVTVEIIDVSPHVADQVAREFRTKTGLSIRQNGWTSTRIAFPLFDRYFFSNWEDGTQEDEAWDAFRASNELKVYAKQLFGLVRVAQANLTSTDALTSYVLKRISDREHPLCFVDRTAAIDTWQTYHAIGPAHPTAFYKKLDELLADPNVASAAFSSMGDHKVLRSMAVQQRNRIEQSGKAAHLAFMLVAFVDPSTQGQFGSKVFEDAWEASILPFGRGNSHCDLYIQGDDEFFASIKKRVEQDHQIPGRYILSVKNEGSIDGFDQEVGEGWFLYTNRSPANFNYLTIDPMRHGPHLY
jgi:hypothetical protein